MACVRAGALFDDDDDDEALVLVYEEVVYAVDDAQVGKNVQAVDTRVVGLAGDVWEWTAPPVVRKRVQMKQLHEEGQVLNEEHFPEPLGFLEQMELPQTVGFPGPLEPVQGMASGSALLAYLAKAYQEG